MKKMIVTLVVSFFMLTGAKSFAQIFIFFEGVKGESSFKEFESSTEISSLNWGAKNTTTLSGGRGATVGKVEMNELVITKPRGSISSTLQMMVFNGKNIPKAEIRFYKTGAGTPVSYLTITLENVLITNWSISAEKSEVPMESFSLVFSRFKTQDSPMKKEGPMEKPQPVSWDIQKNAAY